MPGPGANPATEQRAGDVPMPSGSGARLIVLEYQGDVMEATTRIELVYTVLQTVA